MEENTDTELAHLIKMINQIADNVASGESVDVASVRVADHIRRFWAPSMKKLIFAYADEDGEKLKDVSKQALVHLRTES